MKISNFRGLSESGDRYNKTLHAIVDVETGHLWWRKITVEDVTMEVGNHWFFNSTGKWTPDFEVENAHRAYKARISLEALDAKRL